MRAVKHPERLPKTATAVLTMVQRRPQAKIPTFLPDYVGQAPIELAL